DIRMGVGNIICHNSILTTNIDLGDFNIINLNCTIGHDSYIKNYVTLSPAVNVSGNVSIYDYSYIGTNVSIREKIYIGDKSIVGMGSAVVKDLQGFNTYVGVPAKSIY